MFIFQTRYADMTFEGINARSHDFYIHTSDEKIAKLLRGRKDVWEVTPVAKMIEEAEAPKVSEPVIEPVIEKPKNPPGRPKTIRGSRTADQTQGE